MNRGSYTAATGMIAQQQRLDVLANNLANVNTRGFKADKLSFSEMMKRTVADDAGYGADVATLYAGPGDATQVTDMTQGGAEHTGNAFDLMIKGDGMFKVQTPNGVRYTRNGAFELNAEGVLVTKSGEPVLDDKNQPIRGITDSVEIDARGGIHPLGKKETIATVGRFVGEFRKSDSGGNLFDGTGVRAATNDEAPVASGYLEAANVEPVSLMVEMIALQRAYEISQKMIQSQDESTAKLAETMS